MQLFLTDSAQMARFVGLIYPGLAICVANISKKKIYTMVLATRCCFQT
jgi:hypothetical protein